MEQERKLPIVRDLSANVAGIEGGSQGDSTEGAATETEGLHATGVQEDQDGSQDAGEQHAELQPSLKKPIFIGCLEAELVKTIERHLFSQQPIDWSGAAEDDVPFPVLNKDEYTLLVVHPDVYQGLYKQYLFSELGKEEQDRQNRVQQSAELKQQALQNALQLEYRIATYRTQKTKELKQFYEEHPKALKIFTETELKTILVATQEKVKGKKPQVVTHGDVWNVMDLLMLHGYMEPVELNNDGVSKERVRYKLIINAQDRLDLIEAQFHFKEGQIQKAMQEQVQIAERIKQLQQEIEKAKDEAIKNDPNASLDTGPEVATIDGDSTQERSDSTNTEV
jgi:hypothetical protein